MCCAIRYDNPSIRARSPRRRRTVSAMSWLCAGQRGGTLLSLPRTPISSTSIVHIYYNSTTLDCISEIPKLLGLAELRPFGGSLTGCALKTGCPIMKLRSRSKSRISELWGVAEEPKGRFLSEPNCALPLILQCAETSRWIWTNFSI